MTDDELENLREEKKKQLEEQLEGQEEQKRREEQMKKQELRKLLEPEARSRLSRLKLVKEDKVEAIENMIISQSRKIQGKITDEQLKQIISEVNKQTESSDINIKSRDL